jgi:hypothetical protein
MPSCDFLSLRLDLNMELPQSQTGSVASTVASSEQVMSTIGWYQLLPLFAVPLIHKHFSYMLSSSLPLQS